MGKFTFYLGLKTPATEFAGEVLKSRGYPVVDQPCPAVTHLLLPVPLGAGAGVPPVLDALPKDITVIGGHLPELPGYRCVDLLAHEGYLAENAAITAHCAIAEALPRLNITLQNCPALIIGWGRIGKCLAPLLRALGAQVTVAARREEARAMASALGYGAVVLERAPLEKYRLIFNTVPAPVLSEEAIGHCVPECLKIDLASVSGMAGADVLSARGLPGKNTPETSGRLIAHTIIQLLSDREGSL